MYYTCIVNVPESSIMLEEKHARGRFSHKYGWRDEEIRKQASFVLMASIEHRLGACEKLNTILWMSCFVHGRHSLAIQSNIF